MTSRHLILHCGPHKTGTSAIQAVLRDRPPAGLSYPQTGQWPDGAHHKLLFALQGVQRRGMIDIPPWQDLLPALVAELDAAKQDALISSEHMQVGSLSEFLDRLLPQLSQRFDRISAVLVLRHPLERAASAYNQVIKDSVLKEDRLPDRFLQQAGEKFRLMPLIRAWQQAPVPVQFLSYHPAEDLLLRFLRLIGHDPGPAGAPKLRKNSSMSFYALAALLCGRRIGLTAEQQDQLFLALRDDKANPVWKGPSFPFSQAAAKRFLNQVVQQDLEAVETSIGMALPDLRATPPRRQPLRTAQIQTIRGQLAAFPQYRRRYDRLERTLAALA